MLEIFIRTKLIHAQEWARRPRKRMGSVACLEQGSGSGITRSEPIVSVSHIRLRVYFLEDEIRWRVKASRRHTVINVASRFMQKNCVVVICIQLNRQAPCDGVNGVESQSKYGKSLSSCNCGIASTGVVRNSHSPVWRRSFHITQGSALKCANPRPPVMGVAVREPSTRGIGASDKSSVMMTKHFTPEGKGNSFCIPLTKHERRNASAFCKNK